MTPLNKLHFNTALFITMATLMAWQTNILAQPHNQTENFCSSTPLNESPITLNQVHFIPAHSTTDTDRFNYLQKSFPIQSADHKTLWQQGNRVLTQLPINWDLSNAQQNQFAIVRSKVIKTHVYKQSIGQFIQVIGFAKIEKGAQMPSVVLTITQALKEVMAQDRLISLACLSTIFAPQSLVAANNIPSMPPKVIGFLDEYTIGERGSIILIDQGSNQNIQVGQKWQLIDELPNQPATTKAFGQAIVMERFAEMSVLKIEQLEHEVRIHTPLRQRQ